MICEQIVCITISYHFKQGANLEYVIECWNTVRRIDAEFPSWGKVKIRNLSLVVWTFKDLQNHDKLPM